MPSVETEDENGCERDKDEVERCFGPVRRDDRGDRCNRIGDRDDVDDPVGPLHRVGSVDHGSLSNREATSTPAAKAIAFTMMSGNQPFHPLETSPMMENMTRAGTQIRTHRAGL